jgi:hypothetical protein
MYLDLKGEEAGEYCLMSLDFDDLGSSPNIDQIKEC